MVHLNHPDIKLFSSFRNFYFRILLFQSKCQIQTKILLGTVGWIVQGDFLNCSLHILRDFQRRVLIRKVNIRGIKIHSYAPSYVIQRLILLIITYTITADVFVLPFHLRKIFGVKWGLWNIKILPRMIISAFNRIFRVWNSLLEENIEN